MLPGTALKHSNASAKPGRTTPKGETRVRKAGSHMRSESLSEKEVLEGKTEKRILFEKIKVNNVNNLVKTP